jgi:thiol-disulfide isomerase/thioredoxin
VVLTILLQFLTSLAPQPDAGAIPDPGKGKLKVVDYEGLEAHLEQYADRTLVVNFWATWCVPCVKELPYFEEVTTTYEKDDVVVVLVSLDFSNQIDSRLKPFIEKHQLKSEVILLDDPDQNFWIDQVDPRWSGAIPVTIVRKGERKEFYEQSFDSFEELNTIIQSFK